MTKKYSLGKPLDTVAAHSSGLLYPVLKSGKAFARAKTKAGAAEIVDALNQGITPASASEVLGKLEAFQALANAGVMITFPLDGHLPSVLCLKKGEMYVLEGHELFGFSKTANKVMQTFFKKHYGAALYAPLQDLLLAEAVRIGMYEEKAVEPEAPVPASKPPKASKKSPVVSPVKPAKPSTVAKVSDAWKANQGEAWPDPLA